MRRALYASTALHLGVLAVVAFGDLFEREVPDTPFEVTGVTILSAEEFEALNAEPVALEVPAPEPEPEPEPEPQPEPEPEPEPAPAPEPEPAPPPPPAPEPAPGPPTPAPPEIRSGATDLAASDMPTPREAPRVAPTPAPPVPDVETAPVILERPVTPEVAPAPVEEEEQTAPPEATTEIVTEAEDPSGGPVAPTTSPRPVPRPARPAPQVAEAPPEPDPAPAPTQDAVSAAIADALASVVEEAPAPAPTPPARPVGPPLSQAVQDGFRVAVETCWNVGSLSSEALRTTVVVAFDMGRDTRPVGDTVRLIEFSGGSEAAAQQAFEAARRAILRCGRSGFPLPEESYESWRQVELVFNPNGMRLR